MGPDTHDTFPAIVYGQGHRLFEKNVPPVADRTEGDSTLGVAWGDYVHQVDNHLLQHLGVVRKNADFKIELVDLLE